jgi:arylsulfatase A-like enzyme
VLPRRRPEFRGKMERLLKDSTPDFPKMYEAPASSPNVLLIILTDDVGFGASSTFGGPIQTPNFQRLADAGLRYNMYHATVFCSPTRAALINCRNHHSVASGVITEFATGYPGDNSIVPKAAGSVGEVLKENGYNTSWFRKMHSVPDWMSSQAARSISGLTRGRSEFTYFPGMIRIPEGSAPDFKNKSWTAAAEVTIPEGGANGVLARIGGMAAGRCSCRMVNLSSHTLSQTSPTTSQ